VLLPRFIPDALLHYKVDRILFLGFYQLLGFVKISAASLFGLLKGAEFNYPLRILRRRVS